MFVPLIIFLVSINYASAGLYTGYGSYDHGSYGLTSGVAVPSTYTSTAVAPAVTKVAYTAPVVTKIPYIASAIGYGKSYELNGVPASALTYPYSLGHGYGYGYGHGLGHGLGYGYGFLYNGHGHDYGYHPGYVH